VLFAGTTAVGAIAADRTEYRADEVVLAAGSYGSAAVMLRSGVGPAADLTALGIEVAPTCRSGGGCRTTRSSPTPGIAPLIDSNFLDTGRDARQMLEGVRLARTIAHNPVFAPLTAGELIPGDAVPDADLAEVIAANLALYGHPTATAPMGGPHDEWAIVDAVGAVHGLAGLGVADASIIADTSSTPTNLTVIMLAERIHRRAYAARSRP